jgi:hypothetical protein
MSAVVGGVAVCQEPQGYIVTNNPANRKGSRPAPRVPSALTTIAVAVSPSGSKMTAPRPASEAFVIIV